MNTLTSRLPNIRFSMLIPALGFVMMAQTLWASNPEPLITHEDSLDSRPFQFEFEGRTLSGFIDFPKGKDIKSLVVLIPGSGKTYVHTGRWNYELREHLNNLGVATFSYDKAGCGDSEGEFDYNQSVQNSSEEVLAAINALKKSDIPGSHNLGLWGISRAGWIAPLAITQDPGINYWISVSGPNHLDNIYHLLLKNWAIQGRTEAEIEALGNEWLAGFKIQHSGGTYAEYEAATPTLATDDFIKKLRGEYNEERFLKFQNYLIENEIPIDEETGLQIFIEGFEETLSRIDIPVLAIFGEKDSQINWEETAVLYKQTLGKNAPLTIETFSDCNHMIRSCETGGFDETMAVLREKGLGETCDGYINTIERWLTDYLNR
ncbi:MAG: alpha/beta hydrolase [Bacteroidota bacterium]